MTGGKLLILLPLVAIPVVRRIRQDLNFQRINSVQIRLRIVFMSLGSILLTTVLATINPFLAVLTWAISLSLLNLSLRLTEFERRDDGIWFRSNPWIGGAILLLFLGRVGYRLYQVMGAGGLAQVESEHAVAQFGRTPLSLMVVLLLLSYHATYLIMVSRRASGWTADPGASVAPPD